MGSGQLAAAHHCRIASFKNSTGPIDGRDRRLPNGTLQEDHPAGRSTFAKLVEIGDGSAQYQAIDLPAFAASTLNRET